MQPARARACLHHAPLAHQLDNQALVRAKPLLQQGAASPKRPGQDQRPAAHQVGSLRLTTLL
jgi:hypothetical protein